ncbi:MAG: alcohol dehydrogenase catalytic domain-containing protein [Candidatus Thermoplasmatota archaeon]
MRAAMYYSNRDLRIVEMPMPEIGEGEALLRVEACGICGSDVMEWYRRKSAPRVLGHEAVGEIVSVGKDAGCSVGDRVFVSHHVPCGTCRYCLRGHETSCALLRKTNLDPGGFAEYARIPEENVRLGIYPLPDELSYLEGTFIEPLGCVLRGLRLARFAAGDSALVLGSGISGVLMIRAMAALGAGCILATDISPYRLEWARRAGAHTVHGGEDPAPMLRRISDGRLAEIVVLCTGALSAAEQALRCVDRGGTILFFAPPPPGHAVPLPVNEFWRNEITVTTSYGAAPRDLKEALELLRSGRIKVRDMITHTLPLSGIGEGFRLVAEAGESLKVIVEPGR